MLFQPMLMLENALNAGKICSFELLQELSRCSLGVPVGPIVMLHIHFLQGKLKRVLIRAQFAGCRRSKLLNLELNPA